MRRAERNRSRWDNPRTGRDLLAVMINTNDKIGRLP